MQMITPVNKHLQYRLQSIESLKSKSLKMQEKTEQRKAKDLKSQFPKEKNTVQ